MAIELVKLRGRKTSLRSRNFKERGLNFADLGIFLFGESGEYHVICEVSITVDFRVVKLNHEDFLQLENMREQQTSR